MNRAKMFALITSLVMFSCLACPENVPAQIYYGFGCPPGSVLTYRPIPSAYGVSYIPYCYYPRVYRGAYRYYYPYVSYYRTARPRGSYHYRGTTPFYRSPPPFYQNKNRGIR